MSGFLQKIANLTAERVAKAQTERPVSALEAMPLYARQPRAVLPAFQQPGYNIIAEVKFASPSEGTIVEDRRPLDVAAGYLAAGAAMLSILTEPLFFKGELDYLAGIRTAQPEALLLRKDFMVDAYQLQEARAYGADAILIIVAMTEAAVTKDLFQGALDLGLTPLVEVHDADEMEMALALGAKMIGVNNRDLKTLKTDLGISRELAGSKPAGGVLICESGLSTAADLQSMRAIGYDGFLMGTHFMRQPDPGAALVALKASL